MVWLDPRVCLAARDALQRGNPTEAARLLLASHALHHRAVRNLLVEVGQHLVREAQQRFTAGELEAAEASLSLAARCMALEPEALALQQKVAEALTLQRQHQSWQAAQLEQARACIEQGQFQTALDVLKLVDGHPQAALLHQQAAQKLETFHRKLHACQQALQAGQPEVAYRHWQQAQALAPAEPRLVGLSKTIAAAFAAVSPASSSEFVPIRQRSQSFVLDDLALVISNSEVVLGTPRGEGVHVPILGPLHGRHAVLLRDRQGWQLVPCRDRHGQFCPVSVGGQLVAESCRLVDGCSIQFGVSECLWQFRLPVRGSLTAVLDLLPGRRPCVQAGSKLLGRVVLLDDALRIRPIPPAHLVLPELPCQQLVLRWQPDGLGWDITGGTARLEPPSQVPELSCSLLRLPCRLLLEPQLDEAELLGREVAGCRPAPQLVLEFSAPARGCG